MNEALVTVQLEVPVSAPLSPSQSLPLIVHHFKPVIVWLASRARLGYLEQPPVI